MKYKAISDTYVFKQFKNNLVDIITDSLSQGKVLTQRELEEQFVLIKKYIKSSLKPKILTELQEGGIRLLYVPDNVGKLTSIPFVMSMNNGKLCANILVSSFGNMRQDGMVSVDYRKLYTLMESAYIAKEFLGKYDRYKNDGVLIKNGASIYANMFVKPINKKFNLHLDRNKENTLLFLSAKFYLKNIMGIHNEEIVFNTALNVCKAGNPILLKEADVIVPEEAYANLGTFIEALKEDRLGLGLSALTGRGFVESYIQLYGGSTVFALETMPYFLFVINASISSMGLVNNFSLEDLTEKGGPRIISRFLS